MWFSFFRISICHRDFFVSSNVVHYAYSTHPHQWIQHVRQISNFDIWNYIFWFYIKFVVVRKLFIIMISAILSNIYYYYYYVFCVDGFMYGVCMQCAYQHEFFGCTLWHPIKKKWYISFPWKMYTVSELGTWYDAHTFISIFKNLIQAFGENGLIFWTCECRKLFALNAQSVNAIQWKIVFNRVHHRSVCVCVRVAVDNMHAQCLLLV